MTNTLCPKIGATQWTCTYDECTCHLKETIPVRKRARLADEIEEARARLAALEHQALSATCAELGHKWKCLGGAASCTWSNGPCRTIRCTNCPFYSSGLRN